MQHCFADNMVDRKLYVIVIVIDIGIAAWAECYFTDYLNTVIFEIFCWFYIMRV